jgi:3',5'-cyclic AMP phosphodiesterase CpdA
MSARRIDRRRALLELSAASALLLAGCGTGSGGRSAAAGGSTLETSYVDRTGNGTLQVSAGVPLADRTDLAPRAALGSALATLAHLTDAHVLDPESPARVPFLDRLGAPFASTFRPHETLTAQVLAGAVAAINALGPDAVLQGGDLIDNVQSNELEWALSVLRGGRVQPGSGSPRYQGVQRATNPDPFYYRPGVDAPRHPAMLTDAMRAFTSAGLKAPVHPVLGDHDVLVQGILEPTDTTRAVAVGSRAVVELPTGLKLPSGLSGANGSSPDGVADPLVLDGLIKQALAGPASKVVADPARRELTPDQVLARLRAASKDAGSGALLDYSFDVGPQLRVIVLDLARRDGGSGGLVQGDQPAWLGQQLSAAGSRWVLVVSHQPLTTSEGGDALLAQLDANPRVVAALWGHTHRNRIVARHTKAGGYWLISTGALIDYPQQARALRLRETAGGGVALQTWMLDHAPDDGGLGDLSRALSYLDAQGGRPQNFIGARTDRNVTLYKAAPSNS